MLFYLFVVHDLRLFFCFAQSLPHRTSPCTSCHPDPHLCVCPYFPCYSRSLFWEYIQRNTEYQRENISTPMFIAALFTIAKIWKQPKCPSVDEWIKQLWDIYTVEYCLATKKKKILPFVTVWADLENIMLSKIIWSEKDRHHMISLLCGI